MPAYEYRAKSRTGELSTGVLDADNERVAVAKLQGQGLFPLSVRASAAKAPARGAEAASVTRLTIRTRRISPADVTVFTRQMADLLGGGLSLGRALSVMRRQIENEAFAEVVGKLADDVQGGSTFAAALAKYPRLFPELFIGMIKTGEMAGTLELSLERLAEFMDSDQELRGQVKSAMTYPAIMAVVGTATIIVLLTFVIPRFAVMFEDVGRALPLPTRILTGLSRFLAGWGGLAVVAVVVASVVWLRRRIGTEDGRMWFDGLKLRLPVFGTLVRRLVIARFARTLGVLLKNGVPILPALAMSREMVGNSVLARELSGVQDNVRDGRSLAGPLSKSSVFPPMVTDMVATGEEAGRLEEALLRVADSYDREVSRTLRSLVSLIEPAMILIMGSIVFFVVIAMLLPVFEMSALIGA